MSAENMFYFSEMVRLWNWFRRWMGGGRTWRISQRIRRREGWRKSGRKWIWRRQWVYGSSRV